MRQCVGMLLPVAAIKFNNYDILGKHIHTVEINIHAIRIGAGNIKGFDAAVATKKMFRDTGIKTIGNQGIISRQ